MVNIIKEAVKSGLTQKDACEIFGVNSRKFRRWANPKHIKPRIAWNKIMPQETDAIIQTALKPNFWDKPLSHIFVHGHESDRFHVSLSTVYRVLAKEKIARELHRPRKTSYVSAHSLLDDGFSLLCYDATRFLTESNVAVWAIPVMLLPTRYLLHIGYSLNSVSSSDLTRTVEEAAVFIPDFIYQNLLAHSDRGSAMKARKTKKCIENLLGLPIHYGRPHTPDDQAWIEALIKTLKYHRDVPSIFRVVDDVIQWLKRFPVIYNNDPHSSHNYVTPLQALSGQKEVILAQRKQNLAQAKKARLAHFHNAKNCQNLNQNLSAAEVTYLQT